MERKSQSIGSLFWFKQTRMWKIKLGNKIGTMHKFNQQFCQIQIYIDQIKSLKHQSNGLEWRVISGKQGVLPGLRAATLYKLEMCLFISSRYIYYPCMLSSRGEIKIMCCICCNTIYIWIVFSRIYLQNIAWAVFRCDLNQLSRLFWWSVVV